MPREKKEKRKRQNDKIVPWEEKVEKENKEREEKETKEKGSKGETFGATVPQWCFSTPLRCFVCWRYWCLLRCSMRWLLRWQPRGRLGTPSTPCLSAIRVCAQKEAKNANNP